MNKTLWTGSQYFYLVKECQLQCTPNNTSCLLTANPHCWNCRLCV